MHPVLFEIKGFKIYTYGPIMAFGFLCAFFLMLHIARRRKEDIEFYMDLYIWLIIFGLLGAKILYNIIEYKDFIADPLRMMNCRNGGLVWYGGVIMDTAFVIWYVRRKGLPVLQVTDTLVAPLALGLAIGRWGCLMGGCCYGDICDLPWAIVYPPGVNPVSGLHVHPSPLYESLISLLIALVIYLVVRKEARTGIATALWFVLYPLARFWLEFLRGDELRGFVFKSDLVNISTSQFIGLVIISLALLLLAQVMRSAPVELVRTGTEAPAPAGPADKPKKARGAAKGGSK